MLEASLFSISSLILARLFLGLYGAANDFLAKRADPTLDQSSKRE